MFDRNVWSDYNDDGRKLEPLKPCPCCGGEAWLEDNSYMRPVLDEDGYYVDIDISDSSDCLVECQACGLSTKLMGSPEEAIALWNQRQIPDYSPIIHAHWEVITTHNGCTLDYDCICSNCHMSGAEDKFCRYCGARMDEEVKE